MEKNHTDETLIKILKDWIEKHPETHPSIRKVEKDIDFSIYVFRRRFGTWNKALIKAGYEPKEKNHWTTRYNNKSVCMSCFVSASGKPKPGCICPEHLSCYKRNCDNITKNRKKSHYESLVHYSNYDPPKCVLCGVSEYVCLQLDHIKGDGAEFRRKHKHQSGKSLSLWLRKRGWPKGYRVLCANCQIIERERLGCNGGKKE